MFTFNAEFSPAGGDRVPGGYRGQGLGVGGWVRGGTLPFHHLSRQEVCPTPHSALAVTTTVICALRWAAMRAILIFHSLWGTKSQDSVHRPQLTKTKDREPKRGIEPKSSIYQPDALPLDQTGSRSKTGEFEVNVSSVTSTETVRIIRDGHFGFHTAELCWHSSSMLLYVHTDLTDC